MAYKAFKFIAQQQQQQERNQLRNPATEQLIAKSLMGNVNVTRHCMTYDNKMK